MAKMPKATIELDVEWAERQIAERLDAMIAMAISAERERTIAALRKAAQRFTRPDGLIEGTGMALLDVARELGASHAE